MPMSKVSSSAKPYVCSTAGHMHVMSAADPTVVAVRFSRWHQLHAVLCVAVSTMPRSPLLQQPSPVHTRNLAGAPVMLVV